MKNPLILTLCLLSIASCTEADRLRQSVDALGKSRQPIASVKAKFRAVSPRGNYQTELRSMRNRLFYDQNGPGTKRFMAFVRDSLCWHIDSTGAQVLPREVAWMLQMHEFQWIALFPEQRFRDLRHERDTVFDGQEAMVSNATGAGDQTVLLIFNKITYRWIGAILPDTRNLSNSVKLSIKEWKAVDGLELPSLVVATDEAGDFILAFNEIRINELKEADFPDL